MKQLIAALSVVALAACTTSNPDVISRYDAQRMSQVQDATVLSVRPVTVEGSQSGLGAAAGAVAGGVAGSSVGGSREGLIVGVLGAVAGGLIGNAAERSGTRENAIEVVVQLRNGERRSIVQGRDATEQSLVPGAPVELVTSNGRTRVRPLYANPPAPQGMPVPSAG
jgi:outer membrane lipoprotein SlyB